MNDRVNAGRRFFEVCVHFQMYEDTKIARTFPLKLNVKLPTINRGIRTRDRRKVNLITGFDEG